MIPCLGQEFFDFPANINNIGAARNFKLKPNEMLVIGDRIFSEIKIGNMLGMTTVQMMHGMYSTLVPSKGLETPDFRIQKIEEIEGVLHKLSKIIIPLEIAKIIIPLEIAKTVVSLMRYV